MIRRDQENVVSSATGKAWAPSFTAAAVAQREREDGLKCLVFVRLARNPNHKGFGLREPTDVSKQGLIQGERESLSEAHSVLSHHQSCTLSLLHHFTLGRLRSPHKRLCEVVKMSYQVPHLRWVSL